MALVVAIYAIVSRSRVNRLRLRLGLSIQISIAVLALAFVLSLQFFPFVRYLFVEVLGGSCEWPPFPTGGLITPQDLSFLVVLCWMGLAFAIHKFFSRPSASSALPTISKIVDELVYKQRFAEVIDLVKPYLPLIDQAAHRKLRLQKLHDKIKFKESDALDRLMHPEAQGSVFSKKLRRWVGKLAVLVPPKRKAENAASDIARLLFRSKGFRLYLIHTRPYFAIPLLRHRMYEKQDFSRAYFTGLISDTDSILYKELIQNWNDPCEADRGFPKSYRLLYFLFEDVQTAKDLSVWIPIGRYLLKLLRANESPDPEFLASLNKRAEDFDEERWENPIFAGIYFFELMITSAALQGVEDHMWLYYFPMFVERLEEQYDTSDPSVNISDEFPTRSARFIYEALRTLRKWVLLASELSPDSPHKQFKNLPNFQDQKWPSTVSAGTNIPGSAAIALGKCMRTIALSTRLGEKFAGDMYEVILRTIERLVEGNEVDQLRSFLIQSIVHGGQMQLNYDYGRRLSELGSKVDDDLWSDVRDYRDALRQTYPKM